MATHTPNTEPVGTERDGELPPHVVDGLLASRTRRRLLRRLREVGEPLPVDDLAAAVAASSPDTRGENGDDGDVPADRRRARAEIYQHHLPRLTATGAVAFDSRLGTVEFAGGPRLAARLDGADGERPESGVRTEDK